MDGPLFSLLPRIILRSRRIKIIVGYGAGYPKPNPKLKDSSHLLVPKLYHNPKEDIMWEKIVLSLSKEARCDP